MTLQHTWRWLKVPENYFGAGLLVFALSFILLPTSKQVNNVYYLGLLLPAVIHLALNPSRLIPRSPETVLWMVFFVLASVAGLLGGGSAEFFKHVGYSLIFVLIATTLASPRLFLAIGIWFFSAKSISLVREERSHSRHGAMILMLGSSA